MIDPFGAIVLMIRDAPAVAAIVSGRVSANAEAPPSVQIVANASTRRPFGAGSGRLGLQLAIYFAKCYGPDSPAGGIQARQLAGAVSDALDGVGGVTMGTRFIARAYAPDIEGMERDPDTHWPVCAVRIECYAATQAVA